MRVLHTLFTNLPVGTIQGTTDAPVHPGMSRSPNGENGSAHLVSENT